ncbi:MAG: restriction endonuclease [Comamonadaceae bacterium]|nr:restriction endonuclease [Comamonadaceae bacterium]
MRQREPKPTSWSATVFEAVEWRRFEAVVETLFQQAGFETKSKSHGADEGVDVWLYSRHHAAGPVSLVQCKHWNGRLVGVDKLRELRGVMSAFKVARGQYATTSTFSDAAKAFAGRKQHQSAGRWRITGLDRQENTRTAVGPPGCGTGRRLLAPDLRELWRQDG